jgi:hypothetical protein
LCCFTVEVLNDSRDLYELEFSAIGVDFNNKYNQVVAMLSCLKQSFKSIEKSAQRDWRISQKALAKKNKKADKRSPSGFVRPCLISDEMAVFLGVEVGTMIARTSVLKCLNVFSFDKS